MVSFVNLVCYDSNGDAILLYRLSPGAEVSKQTNIGGGNILAAIPYAGLLGIPMGLIDSNVVTVTGIMTYTHNTRKPLIVLQEIDNVAVYKDTTNTEKQVIDGNWHLIITGDAATETINYRGLPKMVSYRIVSGEGDMCSYTIQLDVTGTTMGGS